MGPFSGKNTLALQLLRIVTFVKWPDEALIPGFRGVVERYLDQVQDLSYKFSSLVAEAFGLGPGGLSQFYDAPELMQHRAKIVRYPIIEGSNNQGVGPHYDGGFLTFVREYLLAIVGALLIMNWLVFSCFKLHHIKGCRCKTYQANGSMHLPYLELSWLILENVVFFYIDVIRCSDKSIIAYSSGICDRRTCSSHVSSRVISHWQYPAIFCAFFP